MSTAVATITQTVQQNRSTLGALLTQMRSLGDVNDLHEVRARAEAMKAWARVHGHVKAIRLELLTVEVEALVRIVELGGLDTLPKRDREAAEYLASLTPEGRAKLLAESGTATTAAGMCRSVWSQEELQQRRRQMHDAGIELAQRPERIPEEEIERRQRTVNVAATLQTIVGEYASQHRTFTTAEMADELIEDASLGDLAADPAIRQGVTEVCRAAVRSAPIFHFQGTTLPRFITARVDDGYIRVPVENALMLHLDDMRAMRREQLKQDSLALAALDEAAGRLREVPGCVDESRIGDLVSRSIREQVAS